VITKARFQQLERVLREAGYGPSIEWSKRIEPPTDAEDFASRVIYVICNSGMRVTIGAVIAEKCTGALTSGRSATEVFGHPGKAAAIDAIWKQREVWFEGYLSASVKLDFLAELPWVGEITKLHLAKNLGASAAKPDVHLLRLANAERTTTARLCRRLARQTGYKVQTIDTILWRACADGVLDSRTYELEGWDAAFRGGRSQELPTDETSSPGS
jgi:hypothetical protein